MFGLMGVARMAGQLGGAFSPLSLFAASEQGAWYDPSDFASMFQDSAGTTPVTAVGQPVGLILDKRLGLALGAELLTNGDFSNGTTGWEAWNVNAQISVSGGQMTVTQPVGGNQVGVGNSAPFTTVVGRTYMVQLDIISYVGSIAPQIRIGDFNGSAAVNMLFAAGTGTRYAYFVATATSTHVNVATSIDAGNTITFDNISVREIPGNHATQATAAARPILRQDGGGKYYLEFDGIDDYLSITSTSIAGTIFAGAASSAAAYQALIGDLICTNDATKWSIRKASDGSITVDSSISTVDSAVLTYETTAPNYSLRANGASAATTTSATVYAAATALFARDSGGNNFGGRVYCLVVRNAASTADEITATEAYIANKAGVTL